MASKPFDNWTGWGYSKFWLVWQSDPHCIWITQWTLVGDDLPWDHQLYFPSLSIPWVWSWCRTRRRAWCRTPWPRCGPLAGRTSEDKRTRMASRAEKENVFDITPSLCLMDIMTCASIRGTLLKPPYTVRMRISVWYWNGAKLSECWMFGIQAMAWIPECHIFEQFLYLPDQLSL